MNSLLPVLALSLSAAALEANTVTVSFEAKIEGGTQNPRFAEQLKAGTLITGKYTFDPEVKDSHDAEEFGEYRFKVPKYGMIVNLANIPLEAAPAKGYYIATSNDYNASESSPGWDDYVVGAEEILCPDPWLAANTMFIQGTDFTATALPSTALPPKFPDLKSFDWCILSIMGPVPLQAKITKVAMDDSLFVPVVRILPAPGDFLQSQTIEPAIRIDGVKPADVTIEKIFLDEIDVTERYLQTSRSGTLKGDNPGAIWQLAPPKPSPGAHEFKVKIRFSNGNTSWAATNWNILPSTLQKSGERIATDLNPDANRNRPKLRMPLR
ncbi:MAG: hypothetical protein ABIS50_20285 [Luteolibacter sp.]|uniref:hypothetical protein n=1 Tax=Luteolibacter sp. TaxID=1962973 RepID=UPI003265AF1A